MSVEWLDAALGGLTLLWFAFVAVVYVRSNRGY